MLTEARQTSLAGSRPKQMPCLLHLSQPSVYISAAEPDSAPLWFVHPTIQHFARSRDDYTQVNSYRWGCPLSPCNWASPFNPFWSGQIIWMKRGHSVSDQAPRSPLWPQTWEKAQSLRVWYFPPSLLGGHGQEVRLGIRTASMGPPHGHVSVAGYFSPLRPDGLFLQPTSASRIRQSCRCLPSGTEQRTFPLTEICTRTKLSRQKIKTFKGRISVLLSGLFWE